MGEGGVAGTTGAGELEGVLENLRALSGEVTTAAVLLKDGELEASTLPPGVDRERYAAMLAALAGITRRSARENGGSSFSQVRIKGEGGYVLLVGLEGGGTLAATTGPDARVGLVLYDMRNTRKEVEKMIGFGGEGGQG
jgi:predicted regulator of Ras-like GTPase activity (Roadblock/LC7/MglB family)